MKILLSIISITIGCTSQAGPRVIGNGGDVIICNTSNGRSITLLDYYEAETQRGIQIDLGAPHLSVEEKIEIALSRLDKISASTAAEYRRSYRYLFTQDSRFISGITLEDIPDSQHILVPNNCKIEQLVIQRKKITPEEPLLLINKDLWDAMDTTQRAGTILHELIYRTSIQNQEAENSINARYFNSKISSKLDPNMTHKEINELAKVIGLHTAMAGNYEYFLTQDYSFHDNNQAKSIFLSQRIDLKVFGQDTFAHETLGLHENGNIQSLNIKPINVEILNHKFEITNVSYYSDGSLYSIGLSENSRNKKILSIHGQTIVAKEIILYKSGAVLGLSGTNYKFKPRKANKEIECKWVNFYETGEVELCNNTESFKILAGGFFPIRKCEESSYYTVRIKLNRDSNLDLSDKTTRDLCKELIQ